LKTGEGEKLWVGTSGDQNNNDQGKKDRELTNSKELRN
jgi:hypothetical protein